MLTVRESRLRELTDSGRGGAGALTRLRGNPERFLATVQIGITVVSSTAAAFGGATIAARIAPLLAQIPALETSAEEIALTLVVIVVSFLSLVLGELVPKSLALKLAEPYALFMARPMLGLATLTRPLVWFLTSSSNLVLKLFGDSTSFTETRMSADEVARLVEEAGEHGSVHPEASAIASRAIAFGELVASDVMIPRPKVVALPVAASAETLRKIILTSGHSRLPVYGSSIDDCIGYVTFKELVRAVSSGVAPDLTTLMREPWFVPEGMPATKLLSEMRLTQRHLALVVDESGGLAGIVTLEDLLEELVGEIFSESAIREQPWRREGRHVVARGDLPLRELNRELGLDLPEGDDWSTLGGLAIARTGRIPAPGERIELEDGIQLEIVDASGRKVRVVRVHLPDANQSSEASEP